MIRFRNTCSIPVLFILVLLTQAVFSEDIDMRILLEAGKSVSTSDDVDVAIETLRDAGFIEKKRNGETDPRFKYFSHKENKKKWLNIEFDGSALRIIVAHEMAQISRQDGLRYLRPKDSEKKVLEVLGEPEEVESLPDGMRRLYYDSRRVCIVIYQDYGLGRVMMSRVPLRRVEI